MNSYLAYWKTFWLDAPKLQVRSRTPDWHSHHQGFIARISRGGELWVVTSGGPGVENEWRLLEHLLIPAQDATQVRSRGDQWRIIADPARSRLFDTNGQGDFAPVLRETEFQSGAKIQAEGRLIGQSIQSPRLLSERDVDALLAYSTELPLRTW